MSFIIAFGIWYLMGAIGAWIFLYYDIRKIQGYLNIADFVIGVMFSLGGPISIIIVAVSLLTSYIDSLDLQLSKKKFFKVKDES
jgi:hypothetical protein